MTTIITPKAILPAFDCAHGSYQRGLLNDLYAWSGADLRGAAARNGGSYRNSRDALVARMRENGLAVDRATVDRGRVIMVVMTRSERRRVKDRPVVEVAQAIIDRQAKAIANEKLRDERAERRAARELAQDIPHLAALADA